MYCRFCGEKIEDDSLYCRHCGKNLSSRESVVDINENEMQEENSKSPSLLWLWVALPFFVITLSVVIVAVVSPDNNFSIVSRELTSSDYTYTSAQDLTSYKITVLPNKNISNCNIELFLYSSDGKVLFTETIEKKNLKKDAAYTYTFNYGFVNSFKGSSVVYKITGKC